MKITRRSLLRGLGGLSALHLAGWPIAGNAGPKGARAQARLVAVFLRGGLDGLAAVPAVGDPHWEHARAGLARTVETIGAPRPLDGLFALDPRLRSLHAMYTRDELAIVHACALPYRERSHFDAQDLLESGGTRPFAQRDGFLARGLASQPAIALAPVLPLSLRGSVRADSWSPSSLEAPSDTLLDAASGMYEGDDLFGATVAGARAARDVAGAHEGRRNADTSFPALAKAAAAFLSRPLGPRVAVLDHGGFDSHSLQDQAYGGLDRSLRALDAGLGALRVGLGERWQHTIVVVTTEFGRTVAMNGSGGTDHGTASTAFVLGGAVAGGRVLSDWPGLAAHALHEGRDLRPTTDLRAVWKGILGEHMGVSPEALGRTVFPGSTDIAPLTGLVRA